MEEEVNRGVSKELNKVYLYVPATEAYIEVDKGEEEAKELQQRLYEENQVITWIVYIKGD